jgi:hypothetical protein
MLASNADCDPDWDIESFSIGKIGLARTEPSGFDLSASKPAGTADRMHLNPMNLF